MLNRNQLFIFIWIAIFLSGNLLAQLEPENSQKKPGNNWFVKNWIAPKYGYAHVGLGRGLSVAGSSDIETAIKPFEMYPVSFDKYFNFTVGFKNLLQVEYRSNKSNHNFHLTEPTFQGGQVTREGIEIEMELTFKEWLFKINPFFKATDSRVAVFLLYGIGNVENLDVAGDGFKDGNDSVFGLDISYIVKYLSASAALEYRKITFKKFILQDSGSLNEDFGMGIL